MSTPIDISERPAAVQSLAGTGGRGTGTPLDDFARPVLWVALCVCLVFLGYLFWGLYGGHWCNPAFRKTLDLAGQHRQMENIALVFRWLQVSTFVFLVALLICALHDETVGYILVGAAGVCYLGLPFLTNMIYDWQGWSPAKASGQVLADFGGLAWLFAVPGILWVLADFVRRFQAASEAAAIQRINLKYGSNVSKQSAKKHRDVFLGRCWEMPYCRDNVRVKCPIFLRRRGPCWWYKEGCMCEERIVLQAVIDSNWKQQTAQTDQKLGLAATVKANLSPAAKRERCRNCIIYNEHERQKFKALTGVVLVVVPVLFLLNIGPLRERLDVWVTRLIRVSERFSFDSSTAHHAFEGQSSEFVTWVILGVVGVVILAQVLRFVEFCCFKLKI